MIFKIFIKVKDIIFALITMYIVYYGITGNFPHMVFIIMTAVVIYFYLVFLWIVFRSNVRCKRCNIDVHFTDNYCGQCGTKLTINNLSLRRIKSH